MCNRFRLTGQALAGALVIGACQEPSTPAAPSVSPSFSSSDEQCVGARTGGTFDNLVVPPGMTCRIRNATVKGNVTALENSILSMEDMTIGGNVVGDKAETVQVESGFTGTKIGGSIQIKEGEVPNNSSFDVFLCGITLTDGNIQVEKMTGSILIGCQSGPNIVSKGNIKVEENVIVPFAGEGLRIGFNTVGQNLQVFKNRNAPGVMAPKTVQNNTAGESIQCKENDLPFLGTPNTASKKEDQCA
jgi:hypothetical protein